MPMSATPFTIAQLSDLHLSGTIGTDISYQKFIACLDVALSHRPNFLLLTGDLVNDGKTAGYDWLFDTLQQSGLPFACLMGNHDVTYEHNGHLPFDKRHFSPVQADSRLANNQRYTINDWQLLCLDSTVPAKIHGHLSLGSLAWLDDTLAYCNTPTIIALHHQPLPVLSAWIDAYMIDNADDFWQIIQRHRHVRAVVCGHVHQAHTLMHPLCPHATLYTCPAVSRQFLPYANDFTLDNQACGFRLFTLLSDCLDSQVVRLPNLSLV